MTASRDIPGFLQVLPPSCGSITEAAAAIVQKLTPNSCLHLNLKFQAEFLDPLGRLWQVVTRNSNLAEVLQDELEMRARCALLEIIKETDSAELFIGTTADREQAVLLLRKQQQASLSAYPISENGSHCLLAIPKTELGEIVREMLEHCLAKPPALVLGSDGNVVVCCEQAHLPIH
jgi:hypothetical protein